MANQKPPSSATMASEINNVFLNMDETKQSIELFQGHECLCNTTSGHYHRREHRTAAVMLITSHGEYLTVFMWITLRPPSRSRTIMNTYACAVNYTMTAQWRCWIKVKAVDLNRVFTIMLHITDSAGGAQTIDVLSEL